MININYRLLFVILMLLLIKININAQKFSPTQQKILSEKAEELVNTYAELMKNISDKDIEYDEKVNLLTSFFNSNNALINNNIEPEIPDAFIPVDKYLTSLKNNYPAGVIIKVKFNDYTDIKPGLLTEGAAKLHVAIPVEVLLTGIYKGKKIVKNKELIYLIYSFNKQGKSNLSNFEFVELRTENDLFPLLNYSYKLAGLSFGMGMNMYNTNDQSAYAINEDDNLYMQFGLSFYQSFSKFLGANIGVYYQTASFSMSWANTNNNIFFSPGKTETSSNNPSEYASGISNFYTDKDGDKSLPFVNSTGITDKRSISMLLIPLDIELKYDILNHYTFYFNLGVQMIYKMSSKITAEGEFVSRGYYPDYDFTLHDLPDYGYTTTSLNSSYTANNGSFSIAPYAAVGAKIFFGDFGINIQFTGAYQTNSDLFYEYGNAENMHQYAPEYTAKQFIEEQLNLNQTATDEPWLTKPGDLFLSFGGNIGLIYKF